MLSEFHDSSLLFIFFPSLNIDAVRIDSFSTNVYVTYTPPPPHSPFTGGWGFPSASLGHGFYRDDPI